MSSNIKQSGAYGEILSRLQEGEEIEALIIGTDEYYDKDKWVPDRICNRVIWDIEILKQWLTGFSFSGGYGGAECPAAYIWTNRRIFFVSTYDGSTWLTSVPRNPTNCVPQMYGGG